jgi:alkylated DNA repair dioxygenase AlkB
MALRQPTLFDGLAGLPAGFRYAEDLLSRAEEQHLLGRIEALPFKPFEFHSYLAKRRVVSFGWRYDYGERAVGPADPLPDFLVALRDQAAAFTGLPATEFRQAMVTEYAPGAGIGWHRDKAEFGEVVAISLLSPCILRFRRKVGDRWERRSLAAQPRSAYVLQGAARSEWQHSIPSVEALRYSVTFRRYREPD